MIVLHNLRRATDLSLRSYDVTNNDGNFFTRTGSYRGHGASALKPKLQVQDSYDVACFTTNTMKSRPIKVPGDNASSKKRAK